MKRRLSEKGDWAEVAEGIPRCLSVSLQGVSFCGCLAEPHIQCQDEPTRVYMLPYIPECPSVSVFRDEKLCGFLGKTHIIGFLKLSF